ncbi:MAG: glycosyltransferase [Gemmatimonadetes bacterium]|nr:glycosyltransferase [Gemmatimonadota bacterium]
MIIPCHNQGRWLGAALASAVAQGDDCEVIVVDDGSTDQTAEIARAVPGVRLVRQAQRGLPAARNAGLAVSSGRFVVFLDADDLLLPGAVQAGRRALATAPDAAFAAGGFQRIDAAGRITAIESAAPVPDDPFVAVLRQSPFPMHAALLFWRRAVVDAGGYDEHLASCEDFDLTCRLLRRGSWVRHDQVVAAYRQHDANMSRDTRRMVATALTVMGRQWPFARDDDARQAAFADGVRFWATMYANDTAWPAASGQLWRGGREAWRGFSLLWRTVPHWMFTRMRGHARARVQAAAQALRARLATGSNHSRRALGEVALAPRDFPLPVGHVAFGDLGRVEPIDRQFGFWRGLPVDRYFIDRFIGTYAPDVAGRVLEVKDSAYTRRFGGDRVSAAEVLDIDSSNPLATWVADLTDAPDLPTGAFDCVILTQTLHIIYDVPAALRTVHRLLKPGGVLLATVPGITKVDRSSPWFWSFTAAAARRRVEEVFPASAVHIEAHGNLLAATAFLQGLAVSEVPTEALDARDEEYPVCIGIRAVKTAATA